jgi:hypothetical protein
MHGHNVVIAGEVDGEDVQVMRVTAHVDLVFTRGRASR